MAKQKSLPSFQKLSEGSFTFLLQLSRRIVTLSIDSKKGLQTLPGNKFRNSERHTASYASLHYLIETTRPLMEVSWEVHWVVLEGDETQRSVSLARPRHAPTDLIP